MAYSFSDYTLNFRDNATTEGFKYTFKQIFSLFPSAVGHLLDTLFALDGLKIMGGDRYNYLHGPFGFIFGAPFLALGWLLGNVAQVIMKAPSYLASRLDLGIDWLLQRFDYFYGPRRFKILMLSSPIWNMGVVLLFTLPTGGLPLPDNMQGPFGFVFGLVPELLQYIVNRVAAGVNGLVRYIVDHVTDVVNYIYDGIYNGLKKCFSFAFTRENNPENDADSSAQLEEETKPILEQTAPRPAPQRRINRKKDRENEIIKDDDVLKGVLDRKIDLFEILGVDKNSYFTSSINERISLIKSAYRKNSMQYHDDRHVNDSDADKAAAREKWDDLLLAKTILLDPVKAPLYISRSNLNRNNLFYHTPDESKEGPAAASTATETIQATGSNDEAPIQRVKIRRKGA